MLSISKLPPPPPYIPTINRQPDDERLDDIRDPMIGNTDLQPSQNIDLQPSQNIGLQQQPQNIGVPQPPQPPQNIGGPQPPQPPQHIGLQQPSQNNQVSTDKLLFLNSTIPSST